MNRGKVCDQRYERLQYAQLDIDALRHGIPHRVDDERDSGMGDGFECYQALQRAQRYCHHFSVLRRASHKHGS